MLVMWRGEDHFRATVWRSKALSVLLNGPVLFQEEMIPLSARCLPLVLLTLGACAPAVATTFESLGGRQVEAAALDQFLAESMDALGVPGVSLAIINDNQIVLHRALGVTNLDQPAPVSEATIFEAASLTKPVFAYFTMRMVEKGSLTLDTPLHDYVSFAELWNGWYSALEDDDRHRSITARTVLSHTTGLPNWRWENASDELSMAFTPGDRFSYSGEGYELLADVLASIAGVDLVGLNGLFQDEVTIPLGMLDASISAEPDLASRKATGHVEGDPIESDWCCEGRAFMASGGLHTEALSYAAFLTAVMRGEGLSESSLNALLGPSVEVPADDPARLNDGVTAWGLGFGMRPSSHGVLHIHGGANTGYRSAFVIQRELGWGYVLFTNSDRGDALDRRLRAFLF